MADSNEVTENFSNTQTTVLAPTADENQSNTYFFCRRAVQKRKEYKNFSLSLELEDWIKFQQYLVDNSIRSGSEFLRELLRKEGVL